MEEIKPVDQLFLIPFHLCYLSSVHSVSTKRWEDVCVNPESVIYIHCLCPFIQPPHKSVADVMWLSSVFDWMIGMFSDFCCVPQTHGQVWAMHLARSIFLNTQLSNQSKPVPAPHPEGRLFLWHCDIWKVSRHVYEGLFEKFRLIHPSSHPNKPQGINCLNTVTLRICLEKDQTKSKASVF